MSIKNFQPPVLLLSNLFEEINLRHFDGFLDVPDLRFNSRLRTSAGRFCPGKKSIFGSRSPMIEVAFYLLDEADSTKLIYDTLAHEMIHYWLWVRRRPYGHGSEFIRKMREMGVSRYNTVPRTRPYRYRYVCPSCEKEYKARKKLGPLACAVCCKTFSNGRYDHRFALVMVERLDP